MARSRLHSLEELLDVAERIVTTGEPAGLTLRGLAAAAQAPNGTIYHAFGSKDELLARLWLRASGRLGVIMRDAVRGTGGGEPARGIDTVVALALAPVVLARQHRESAQLFFAQRRDQLFSTDLSATTVAELHAVQARFVELLIASADAVWGRADRVAVEAITTCVVDIPGGLLRRRLLAGHDVDSLTERRIEAAARAVLRLPLDPAPGKPPTPRERP